MWKGGGPIEMGAKEKGRMVKEDYFEVIDDEGN
jgi:hypothetical protein